MRQASKLLMLSALSVAAMLIAGVPIALGASPTSISSPYRPGVVLVGFRQGVSTGERYAIERAVGGQGARHLDLRSSRPVGEPSSDRTSCPP